MPKVGEQTLPVFFEHRGELVEMCVAELEYPGGPVVKKLGGHGFGFRVKELAEGFLEPPDGDRHQFALG
jgi:hypothetical protein